MGAGELPVAERKKCASVPSLSSLPKSEQPRFDVDKVPLILPVHNSSEWAMGRRRTEEPPGYVGKLVSSNLQSKAPRVYTLIERFAFDIRILEEVVQVLAEGGVSARDPLGAGNDVIFRAACDWVKSSESMWRNWIPTTCDEGSGLADVGGPGSLVG